MFPKPDSSLRISVPCSRGSRKNYEAARFYGFSTAGIHNPGQDWWGHCFEWNVAQMEYLHWQEHASPIYWSLCLTHPAIPIIRSYLYWWKKKKGVGFFFCEEKAYLFETAVRTDCMISALIWASNTYLDGSSTQSKLTQNYRFSYGDYKWISSIRIMSNPNAQNFPNAQKYYVYFKCMLKIHSSKVHSYAWISIFYFLRETTQSQLRLDTEWMDVGFTGK